MKVFWGLVVIGALLVGCSSSGGSNDASNPGDGTSIAVTPLAGKIGGQAWTFESAQTDPFLSTADDDHDIGIMTSEPKAACGSFPTMNYMYLPLPRKAGTYPLGLSLVATFVIPSTTNGFDNLGATKGRVRIDEVSDTSIRGGAFVEFDANNSVNGQFEVAVCAE